MKNKKGEANVGLIVIIVVGIIVGLILTQAIASYVSTSTNLASWSNQTVTLSSTSNYTDIAGAQSVSGTYVVTNATGGAVITSDNITLVERVANDGLKGVSVQVLDTRWNGKAVNITGSYGPDGYIDNSGGRQVAVLIVLMAALGVVAFAMIPSMRNLISEHLFG